MIRKLPFVLSTGRGFSSKNNYSQLVNLFIHTEDVGSKSRNILLNTDGSVLVESINYIIYGLYVFNDLLYIITSDYLYSYDGNTLNQLKDIQIQDKVFITDNRNELVFTDGNNSYSYNPSYNYLKDLSTESNFYDTDSVDFLDGYLIFNKKNSDEFFISNLYDTTFDATQFATAESYSDKLKAVYCNTKNLWLFGERSIEIWYNSGNSDFPFAKVMGATHSIGLLHKNTLAKAKDTIFFIGNDYRVYIADNYSIRQISINSINKIIEDNKDKNIKGYTFSEYGHDFYYITIEDTTTLVYDLTTQQWHNRKSTLPGSVYNYWFYVYPTYYNNKLYAGNINGSLYELSMNYYTENGENIYREITTLPLSPTQNRYRLLEVWLDLEVGLADYNADNKIYLQYSKDGGKTWSNYFITYMGNKGEYYTRVKWHRLGQFGDMTLRFFSYANIPFRIIAMEGRISI